MQTGLETITFSAKDSAAPPTLEKSQHKWLVGLCVTASLGLVSGILGLAIAAGAVVDLIDPSGGAAELGTWLTIASFPLLICAAHCVDKRDQANRLMRREHFRAFGLKVDRFDRSDA